MGRKECQLNNICPDNKSIRLKVTYTCVKETQRIKSCSQSELSKPKGFIQNEKYPSMSIIGVCQWKIHVPQESFIILRLHDVMLQQPSKGACAVGLRIVTERPCEGHNFTSEIICRSKQSFQSRYFLACGNVTVMQVSNTVMHRFRFWISYEVQTFAANKLSYLYDKNLNCIDSKVGYQTWKVDQVNSPHLSHVSSNHSILSETTKLPFNATSPGSDSDNFNGTLNTSNKMKPSVPLYNLKLILAIGAPLLAIILFVSIGICYWRSKRSKRKNNPVSAKDAAVQTLVSRNIENVRHANGILPLQCSDRHHPAIQEGYSHVADEVPFPEAAKMIDATVNTCEAYTEVDEGQIGTVKPLSDRFRYHIARSLPALPGKKSSSNDEWTSTRSRGSSSRASIGSENDYQKAIYEEIPDYYECKKHPSNYSPRVSEPSSVETDSGIESEDKLARSRLERIQNPTNPGALPPYCNLNSNLKTNTNSSSSSTSSSSSGSHKSPPIPALNPRGEIKSDDMSQDVTDPKYHVVERNCTQNNVGETNCRGHSIARSGDDGLVLLENEIYEPYYQQTD
ncbi:uncharacterized protein LOC115225702 [Octopus sinensis]|uniref:Uncharacterized protein LOC115225702 n=1 Tax=Octopus sinensis TaxID=2607531 RepID=A0A6P7TUH1_9MOLL|nr:uncharacterized protein LOC115225702 [Octopus sinensis]